MPHETSGRREFLLSLLVLALPGARRRQLARGRCAPGSMRIARRPHPDPRPGVDGSKVLRAAQLDDADAAPAFDEIRAIPQIADGIRCQCGCADQPGYRSLLSCFEGEGMAQHCAVCQAEAHLAHQLHARGESLKRIRAAMDERFG